MRKIQKEVIGKADNKGFFDLFFKSKEVTNTIGYFGQFVSGLTEFNFVFKITGGSYQLSWSSIIPALLGFVAIYIFEVIGVRIYLVKIIRQIVAKQFKTTSEWILFGFNLFFVLCLCGVNIWFSILGQKSSFHSSTNVRITDKTQPIEKEKAETIKQITKKYDKKENRIRDDYSEAKDKKSLEFDTKIENLRTNRWTHEKNSEKYDNYTTLIDTAINQKSRALATLEATFNKNLSNLEADKENEINLSVAGFDKRITDIEITETADINLFQNIQKYTLPILLIFIILSWISIIYIEVFYKGSEQKIEVQETSSRPIIFIEFLKGVYNKAYDKLYRKLVKFLGNEKFEYEDIQTKIVKIKPDEILKNDDNLEINNTNIAASTTRQIGFSRNQNETANDNRNNENRSNPEASTQNKVNMRICANCGNSYIHRHHKQKYCQDSCRINAWENRTGQTFNKKSKHNL